MPKESQLQFLQDETSASGFDSGSKMSNSLDIWTFGHLDVSQLTAGLSVPFDQNKTRTDSSRLGLVLVDLK